MNNVYLLAVMAGLFFGLWPYVLHASGAKGILASASFCTMQALFLLFFTYGQWKAQWNNVDWRLVIMAGTLSGTGLWMFTRMTDLATHQTRASLIVLNMIVQIAVSTIYFLFVTSGERISITRFLGFILAGIAVIVMLKKD